MVCTRPLSEITYYQPNRDLKYVHTYNLICFFFVINRIGNTIPKKLSTIISEHKSAWWIVNSFLKSKYGGITNKQNRNIAIGNKTARIEIPK